MAGDLDDFLKRAAQRRVANATAKAEEKARQEKQNRPIRAEYSNRNRERVTSTAEPDDDVVVAKLAPTSGHSNSMSTEREGTNLVRSLASSQVSPAIQLADDFMNARIHEKFDQEVGNFDVSRGFAGGEPNTVSNQPKDADATARLRVLFGNSDGLRQVILAREIFDRPIHRW